MRDLIDVDVVVVVVVLVLLVRLVSLAYRDAHHFAELLILEVTEQK